VEDLVAVAQETAEPGELGRVAVPEQVGFLSVVVDDRVSVSHLI